MTSLSQTRSVYSFDAAFAARPEPSGRLPWVRGNRVTLRDLWASDAVSLSALVTTAAVTRFIPPPPRGLKGFRDFIAWTRGEQQAGRQSCFALVPHGQERAAGFIQVRFATDAPTAEWGFVLGQRYWGTGLFAESAALVMDFLFATAGIHRLDARTAVSNPRGNGVLQKLGFHRDWSYAGAFVKDGDRFDEALWSITAERWKRDRLGSLLRFVSPRRDDDIARRRTAH